jgi:UDP-N-acetyl-D-mannosaminuronic acid dehydrogenase
MCHHTVNLNELQQNIATTTATIGVVGLGYVGLPVACVFAQARFRVIGVDIKPDRVALINQGQSPIEGDEPGLNELLSDVVTAGRFHATTDIATLSEADIITINVETPVDEYHQPRYEALKAVCRTLGPVLKDGALVIVESTVAPGTTEELVGPLLEESSGKRVNEGFYVGACPERVMPGKLLANIRTVSRVCGGSTPEVAETMVKLYGHIVQADLDPCDVRTAELVKTTENAYRDVQIAFANEVALICEANGANVWRVRELVNKSPYRQMHLPGAGVGGHCIPKDPWLLASSAQGSVQLKVIPAARSINDGMPIHVAQMTMRALEAAHCPIEKACVAILGYAYLENSDDTRNSPSEALVEYLERHQISVRIHDPWVAEYQGNIEEVFAQADAAILMVGHTAYRELDLASVAKALRTPILIDGRGMVDPAAAKAAGLHYDGVGAVGL